MLTPTLLLNLDLYYWEISEKETSLGRSASIPLVLLSNYNLNVFSEFHITY